MASGNQVKSGIWADLPVAPTNKHKVMMVIMVLPTGITTCLGKNFPEINGPEGIENQKNAD